MYLLSFNTTDYYDVCCDTSGMKLSEFECPNNGEQPTACECYSILNGGWREWVSWWVIEYNCPLFQSAETGQRVMCACGRTTDYA